MTDYPVLNQFLSALVSAYGLSPMTQTGYRWKLTPLFEAWADIPMEDWDYGLFEDFLVAQDWAPATLHKFWCSCKRFIAWAQSRKLKIQNFVGSYHPPKTPPNQPKTISREDLIKLLDNCEGHRMEIAIGLAGLAGMRRCEIDIIQWSDVDFEEDQLRVFSTKTKKTRYVPISDRLKTILKRHTKGRAPDDDVLDFPHFAGTTGNGNRDLHKLCEKADVKPHGFHHLRHTWATLIARAGTDINTLAELLGHADLQMTKIYCHADTQDKKTAVAAVL